MSFEICQNRASSCLKTIVRPKRTLSLLFGLLFPLPLLMSSKRKLLEREVRRVLWEVHRDQMKWAVCARRRLAEADVENEDEHVGVVSGVDEVGVSGYESEVFTLPENLRRKRLAKKEVSEGVVDTAHLPQCEFSNLHHIPLTFLLECFVGQSLNSIRLVVQRALKHEVDFVRLLYFSV